MMPIKGTKARVKPGQCVCGPETGCRGQDKASQACAEFGKMMDIAIGKELQGDLKERAENLMVSQTAQIPRLVSVYGFIVADRHRLSI